MKTNFKLVDFNLKKIVFLGEVGGEPWKNYIISLGKRYIYQCRCIEIELNEIGFEKYLVQYMNIEYTIAKDNKKVTDLLEKWSVLHKVIK